MDTNEALTSALRSMLCQLLCAINNKHKLWHYAILLPESDTSSLASLLGLRLDELVNILKMCGLIKENKSGVCTLNKTPTIKPGTYSWEELLHEAGFVGNYFDKMKVVAKVKDLKIWWLGIGYTQENKRTEYNPSTQFNNLEQGPPELDDSLKVIVAKYSTRMKDLSKLIAEGNTEESQENTDDVTCPGHQKDATVNDHVYFELYNKIKSSISSILSLDDKFEFKQSVDNFVGVVLKDDFEKQSQRAKSIQGNDSDTFTPLNFPDDDFRSKLPLLARLHLPLTPYFISTLLNEIIKLSETYLKDNLLTMKKV